MKDKHSIEANFIGSDLAGCYGPAKHVNELRNRAFYFQCMKSAQVHRGGTKKRGKKKK